MNLWDYVIGVAADGLEAVEIARQLRRNALRAGARGFVLKDAGPELLAQAIHAAANGDALISPSVTARLLSTFAKGPAKTGPVQPLTKREDEVLVHVAHGLTNAEIAEGLHVSLSTVKTHLASLATTQETPFRLQPTDLSGRTGERSSVVLRFLFSAVAEAAGGHLRTRPPASVH